MGGFLIVVVLLHTNWNSVTSEMVFTTAFLFHDVKLATSLKEWPTSLIAEPGVPCCCAYPKRAPGISAVGVCVQIGRLIC
jgi:hypothetical protein